MKQQLCWQIAKHIFRQTVIEVSHTQNNGPYKKPYKTYQLFFSVPLSTNLIKFGLIILYRTHTSALNITKCETAETV